MTAAAELTIERLGHRGDGVARGDGGDTFVPYALPGEIVRVEPADGDRARLVEIVRAASARVDPICGHFTRCGGCALQHLDHPSLLDWKRSLVVEALRQRGIDAPVAPCIDAHGEGRRRVTLHARHAPGGIEAGFMMARSHRLIAIDRCPVLAPSLSTAPQAARAVGETLAALRKPLDIQVTATLGGLDIDIRGAGRIDDRMRLRLIECGQALDLARLSLHGEALAQWRAPSLRMGRAVVTPPPGGFLQATAKGEEALAGLALQGAAGAKLIGDLFSGCGPIALRAAESARVLAVEMERAALDALERGARATSGIKPVSAEARDLFRRPLLPLELERFNAVIVDPPRAGAEAQARALAAARRLKTVVGVSCNAATFARDARILLDGGFALESVTPVDQFRYSAHVELVGVFRR